MKDYDVIVIGSGIGGLSSALTLAKAGKKVLMVEQHNLPGGCSTSFVRGRFEFDASLHELCGIGEPGKWGYTGQLLNEDYGLPIQWKYSNELYRVIAKARSGKIYDVTLPTGCEAVCEKLEEYVPGSKKPMEQFIALAKECYAASLYFDQHMWEKKKSDGTIAIKASIFLKHFFNYLLVAERPFNEVLHRIKMPEDAIDILNTYWVYLGANLDELSFVAMAVMIYCYIEMKPAIPYHTSHALATEMVEKLKSLGGEAYFNVKAKRIVSDEKGRIQGVDTDVGFIPSKHVIANVNPATAYGQLLDPRIKIPKREKKKVNAIPFSTRLFNVYLGLNRSAKELGIENYTVFCPGVLDSGDSISDSLSIDNVERATATCYNAIYPDCSPEGTSILTLTVPFSDDSWASVAQRDYVKVKERVAEMAITTYEKATGIIIRPYIEEIEIATPWTFARYLGTPQGTVYGNNNNKWNSMGSQLLGIRKDQPIKGFKTTGASGARGDGYSQALGSGKDIGNLTLEEIREEEKRNGKKTKA